MSCDNAPVPRGYQQLTGLDVAQALTLPPGANFALIRCTGGNVRWRDDGGVPTATTGQPLNVGEELTYDAVLGLPELRFIEQSATAEVSITYYGV